MFPNINPDWASLRRSLSAAPYPNCYPLQLIDVPTVQGNRVRKMQALTKISAMTLKRDLGNLLRYGKNAPKLFQRIWVSPEHVDRRLSGYPEWSSAEVVDGEWDLMAVPLVSHHKIISAYAHWRDGLSWHETGVVERILEGIEIYGSSDGCKNPEDIELRLASLDRLFESIRSAGRLKTRKEIYGRWSFRERGGIRVNIARDGQPIFGGSGYHRLAISRILGLKRIPAQIGVVHPEAIHLWKLGYLR